MEAGARSIGRVTPIAQAGPIARSSLVRLAVFAALAAFAAGHWLALLSEPPVARVSLALIAIATGAVALAAIERAALPRPPRVALAAAALVVATALALVAVGVPASTLLPGAWDELGAGVDRGLAGLGGDVEFPYAGPEPWSRLLLLGCLACLLALAAALAFWPRSGAASGRRLAALVVLAGTFAAAAAMHSSVDTSVSGAALLLGVAAWLWLPDLSRRQALAAGAAIAFLALVSLPVAAALEGSPWIKYRSWELAAQSGERNYSWDHSYGPLSPRDGTALLEVRSDRPHYWRAAVLDDFNGYGWARSRTDVGQSPLELPTRVDGRPAGNDRAGGDRAGEGALNPDWLVRTEVDLRALRSEFAIAPGTLRGADGIALDPTPNGTVFADDVTLGEGDAYTAFSYAPEPGPARMRAAASGYAPALARHTRLTVPSRIGAQPGEDAPEELAVPLRGTEPARASRVAARLAASRYGPVYELARRWTAGAASPYDAAHAVERRLRSGYAYVERVPLEELPLLSFLFEQRAGYCQQFSGAMALMLRMVGIPARVAAGFSPGTPSGRPGRYLVTDYDAHSWVEVYFTGIGWVAFDPTPGAAPAELQTADAGARLAAGRATAERAPAQRPLPEQPASGTGSGGSGGVAVWPFATALALALAAVAAAPIARIRRHRALGAAEAAEVRSRELASALDRLGWGVPETITLRRIEDRMRAARRPAAADYAGALVALRFGAEGGRLPSLAQRRKLRGELRRIGGWDERLASFRAIPLGAPRRRR